ncbi:lasso peptide biosynthesis PqqD family chaperone [Saccharothrix australiensis]|uniref:Coenzyme PQQ synthesis protein D (PqqD) n=1 Tax=Saccharothrix australiensis TaxID=2072 RepID=A0A495W4I7_9PSEU|nr:lasso peptide biosynthesis PqqD family chaperone [Saccharothrix australiensis]RKT54718.1 coenzyme PQQ synthesis protein D (PqqD) [Saccharothrix australiensis]
MTLRLAHHVSVTTTEDGAVLLDERTGRYWQLNQTGSEVLRTLLDGGDQEDAARLLAERGGADRATVASDVADVVAHLCSAGLAVRR